MAQELQGSGLHIFLSPKQLSSTCYVSLLAARDTDHEHKFSLTYLSYLSDGLTNTLKIFGTRSTQIPSLRGYEPKTVETNAIETKAIEREDLEPEELSLTGILGQIRIKYRKDC